MTPPITEALKSLRTVYIALMMGIISFSVISIFLNQTAGPFSEEDDFFKNVLLLVSSTMAVISIYAGTLIFKKRMEGIEKLTLMEKLDLYRSAMIVRAATMEGSGFFFIICFVLAGSPISFVEIMAILAIMIYFFPSNNRLATEIKHDQRELERSK